MKWYTLAAEQGNAFAQSNLGFMYDNGHGVLQDYVYAHMWFNIAASSGNKIASENRDIVAERMTPADISAGSLLLTDFCLIFVPFGHYDEPEILRYAITSICPKGADVRHL